jgi:hypothetical protein
VVHAADLIFLRFVCVPAEQFSFGAQSLRQRGETLGFFAHRPSTVVLCSHVTAPMGPKAKVVEPVVVVGAKIATLVIGPPDVQLAVKVNLNCPLDIVLDFLRKQFNAAIDQRSKEILSTLESQNEESPLGAAEREKALDLQNRLGRIRTVLAEDTISNLELFEGANSLSCQQVPYLPLLC